MLQDSGLLRLGNYTLIITEKPDAAARIASGLDVASKPRRNLYHGVPYYEANREKSLVVVPALGHLYTVASGRKRKGEYPVFEFKWVPLYVAERDAKGTRVWLETITKLASGADAFIDACDYDVEGSIIGYNILKYACGGKETEAKRMKFSTLTKQEIEQAYQDALPSLDFGLIEAGLARHEVDWLYGVNLSRALTQAAKKSSGYYTTLSTGRVQGPTLKVLAAREKIIRTFVPTQYWTIKSTVCVGDSVCEVSYEKKMIDTKDEADAIVEACRGKKGRIETLETKRVLIPPPSPFDLGSLQREAYRVFRYSPLRTSKIAQRLYLDALISYPRTSSQKLPPAIGYKAILEKLAESHEHGKLARELLAKPALKPKEGKNYDSAHPAIYSTGSLPGRTLNSAEKNIWNLIVKRFMATFADYLVQRSIKATAEISGNRFRIEGKETLQEGWLQVYKPYVHSNDILLPEIVKGQEVNVKTISAQEEFTKPPHRYTPSSLLKRMEKLNLGTKATRAGIIQTLCDRKYITDDKIMVTNLGFEVVDVLKQNCPTVLSSSLTAELEERMREIQEMKETRERLLAKVIEILKPVTGKLKEREIVIGEQLSRALRSAKLEERDIGACPNCKTGRLIILYSKKTGKRFIGCTNYFEGTCKNAFPLPQQGILKLLPATCKGCGYPTLQIWIKGRHAWRFCINQSCPLKRTIEEAKHAKSVVKEEISRLM